MLPIRDVIPSRTTPGVVITLIAVYAAGTAAALIPHPGWLAVAGNVLAFGVLGETLEDRLGHPRLAAFVLLGGAAGAAAWLWLDVAAPVAIAAATGAVAAALGGYFSLFWRSRVLVFLLVTVLEVPALVVLGLWAALHTLSLDPIEAAWIGRGLLAVEVVGLAVGAAAVRLFTRRDRADPAWWS